VRVAIAEDSVLLREGVARLLTDEGFEVTARCGNADELLVQVRSDPPDVVIVDIRLPPTHTDEGMRAALAIRSQQPGVGVLVLSQYVEVGLAMRLLAESAEGAGYLLKDRIGNVRDFTDAVCAGSRQAVPRWTRRSSRRCSSATDSTIPCTR
jgi:DNA-binding NarL/FixJ family response regulator